MSGHRVWIQWQHCSFKFSNVSDDVPVLVAVGCCGHEDDAPLFWGEGMEGTGGDSKALGFLFVMSFGATLVGLVGDWL